MKYLQAFRSVDHEKTSETIRCPSAGRIRSIKTMSFVLLELHVRSRHFLFFPSVAKLFESLRNTKRNSGYVGVSIEKIYWTVYLCLQFMEEWIVQVADAYYIFEEIALCRVSELWYLERSDQNDLFRTVYKTRWLLTDSMITCCWDFNQFRETFVQFRALY